MQSEHVKPEELYQDKRLRRVGKAVAIEADQVTLQDEQGNKFNASLNTLAYAPVKTEGDYWIDLNTNYPKRWTNAFLCKRMAADREHAITDYECIGGADLVQFGENRGQWQVTVDAPYNEETASDARFIGYFTTREEAVEALWDERNAISLSE